MEFDAFVSALFARAKAEGIEHAEVYYASGDSLRVRVRDQKIEDYTVSTRAGLSLRGVCGGRMGYASTEALDEAAVDLLVQGVRETAALIDAPEAQDIFPGSPAYAKVEQHAVKADPQALIAQAMDMERQMQGEGLQVDDSMTQLTSGLLRIVNTYGLNLRHEDGAAFAMASLVARRGERTADGFAFDWSAEPTALDTADVARRAVQTARFMLDAAPVPSGEYDVIFRREAMADLLETFAGIFSAENAQRRLSLLAGRVGETIAAPCVTIVDDPLLPGGPATCAFDAEGVATYAKHVVEGGVLKTLLHNRSTARKDGVASTGNASRAGYSAPVRVSPTNFFFPPASCRSRRSWRRWARAWSSPTSAACTRAPIRSRVTSRCCPRASSCGMASPRSPWSRSPSRATSTTCSRACAPSRTTSSSIPAAWAARPSGPESSPSPASDIPFCLPDPPPRPAPRRAGLVHFGRVWKPFFRF